LSVSLTVRSVGKRDWLIDFKSSNEYVTELFNCFTFEFKFVLKISNSWVLSAVLALFDVDKWVLDPLEVKVYFRGLLKFFWVS